MSRSLMVISSVCDCVYGKVARSPVRYTHLQTAIGIAYHGLPCSNCSAFQDLRTNRLIGQGHIQQPEPGYSQSATGRHLGGTSVMLTDSALQQIMPTLPEAKRQLFLPFIDRKSTRLNSSHLGI